MTRALRQQWQATWDMKSGELERQINDELVEILQREIDREILDKVREQQCREQGWYRVPPWDSEFPVIPRSQEIGDWLAAHCQGRYYQFHGRAIFENQEDAVAFALTWT